jgi:hypothetical protein
MHLSPGRQLRPCNRERQLTSIRLYEKIMSARDHKLESKLTHSQLHCQLTARAMAESNLQPTVFLILDGLNEELAHNLHISTAIHQYFADDLHR